MVTHELRIVKFFERVLQIRDGKLVRLVEVKNEILALRKGESWWTSNSPGKSSGPGSFSLMVLEQRKDYL